MNEKGCKCFKKITAVLAVVGALAHLVYFVFRAQF